MPTHNGGTDIKGQDQVNEKTPQVSVNQQESELGYELEADYSQQEQIDAQYRQNKDIGSVLAQQRSNLRKERRRKLLIIQIAAALLAIVIILNFVICAAVIHGEAMNPTFCDGDTGIVLKIGRKYERGDIVLFRTDGVGVQALRIIAGPGDKVSIDSQSGAVLVNGQILSEPYANGKTAGADIIYPVALEKNEYFLLGDNRENSMDSRFTNVGVVSSGDIMGKLILLIRGI